MIGLALKPQDMNDSKKQQCVNNEWGPKITLFVLNCGLIDVLTWIFIHCMWSQKDIFSYEKTK
jgi:hypothetical protein